MLRRFAIAACAVFAFAFAGVSQAAADPSEVPTPAVTGPIPASADSYPFLATDIDLASYGYVEEEYFLEGDAWRYDTSGPVNQTATRIETGGTADDGAFPFKTRMVVRRPANPADFNGTVVAEWYNVTALYDLEANWFGDPYYLLENGYAFVGISAQTIGISALKDFDNDRYGDLTVNGDGAVVGPPDNDALSYDIFSSAVKAIKGMGTGVDPMGSLDPDMVIASGESQSCGRLSSHHNKVQPIHEIVDAYLLTVCTSALRTDRPEKTIRVLSETETRVQRTTASFPDNDTNRHWEVAGGSHIPFLARDNWAGPVERDRGVQVVECEKTPLSKVEWPFVQNQATHELVAWTNGGDAPPVAPRGEYVTPSELARDALGIAKGGIRLPEMDVPVAVNTGSNAAAPGSGGLSLFCILLGSWEPFEQETLGGLYADWADYVARASQSADAVGAQGFVLPEDVERLKENARNYYEVRPTVPALDGQPQNRGQFSLAWQGTQNPGATFRLESKSANGDWAVDGNPGAWQAITFSDHAEGTFSFRVRSETDIPATNITEPRVAITQFSDELTGIKVDRSGPLAPVLRPARRPDSAARGGWYRGPVRVTAQARADRPLPDGSPGVGLDTSSLKPLSRTINRAGVTRIDLGTTSDLLGNVSPRGVGTIRIDRRGPAIRLACPKRVKVGRRAFVRARLNDPQSGLVGKANRRIRINSKRPRNLRIRVVGRDRVGNVTRRACVVRVRR